MRSEEFFIWAHRGASAATPENTLAAFRSAEAAGAGGVELDVHLTRDQVPVVIHDVDVARTTDGRGGVRGMLLRDLRRLDAGSWFGPAFAGERVPTLAEVLDWAQDRLRVNVEIKTAAAGEAVLRILGDFPASRVLISSFDHNVLEGLRQYNSELHLGFVTESLFWRRVVKRAGLCRAESLHPRLDRLSPVMLEAARRRGLKVYPWTVNDAPSLMRLQALGVDGVFTDDPQMALQALRMTEQSGEEGF